VGGTPGGDQQTQWSAQSADGAPRSRAVAAGRRSTRLAGSASPGTDPATLGEADGDSGSRSGSRKPRARSFRRRGHALTLLGPWSGGGAVQLVALDRAAGILRGASDRRAGRAGARPLRGRGCGSSGSTPRCSVSRQLARSPWSSPSTGSWSRFLRTDEGLTGLGYTLAFRGGGAEAIQVYLETRLKPLLLGEDPRLVARLWERMYRADRGIKRQGIAA